MTETDRQGEAPATGRSREDSERRRRRTAFWRALFVWLVAIGLLASAMGCAVTEDDLRRWETTQEGPRRLRAVVLSKKYPYAMRVQAALALIRMKPRKGQRVGIKELVENTLAKLDPDVRGKIVADLVPLMIQELKREVPPAQAGQPAPPDPSFPIKDAAYMMLTFERTSQGGTTIVADPALRRDLEKALTDWAMADFERRLNDRSQAYGMEQLLRYIGPSSAVGIPKLMTKNAKSLTTMADLVAKLGDDATKEEGGKRLVEVVEYIASDQWRAEKKPELEEANRKAMVEPTDKQFEAQLVSYQDETLMRVFGSMKQVGGHAVVDYCLRFAGDKAQADKRRNAALAALEGRIPRDDPVIIERVLAIASSEPPDIVMDQVFRRIRELPRDKVVDKVYDLFKTDKWKIRRAAGATLLQMSTVKHIDEFMRHLSEKATKNFSLGEAMTYGAYLGDLKEGNVRDALRPHMDRGLAQARLAAIGYYFTYGTKNDLPALAPFEEDKTKIPKCDEEAKCAWECEVAKEGDPNGRENKEVKTVGDFVKFCVEPQMLQNQAKPKDDKPGAPKDQKEGTDEQGQSP